MLGGLRYQNNDTDKVNEDTDNRRRQRNIDK